MEDNFYALRKCSVLRNPAGYAFGGWYLSRECEGNPVLTDNSFTFNDEIPDGATLYAKWIPEQ